MPKYENQDQNNAELLFHRYHHPFGYFLRHLFFSANYREADFYRRLKNRAINTTNIFVQFQELEPALLELIEKDNPANLPNQFIRIFDQRNTLVYSSQKKEVLPVSEQLLHSISAKDVRFRFHEYEAIAFLFLADANQYKVIAAATDVYGYNALTNLRNILIIVFLVSILLVSFSGWIYAGRMLRPISKIVNEVDSITEANLNVRLDEGDRSDELNKLSQTFNRMLTRLEEAFLSQKQFIANASHELRTPIAVLVAEVEATLIATPPNHPHHEVLVSLLDSGRKLKELANQLLLLAQTSAHSTENRFTQLRVDEILWEVKEQIEKANPDYEIEIHFAISLDHESLQIRGDEQLIRIVFANMIDNGCKYSDNNTISVTLTVSGDFVVMDFVNQGPGIVPEDINRIFTPFFRGSNIKNVKGYGIGLSLASRIIVLHSGALEVHSIPNRATSFKLSLPRSR